MSILRRTPFWGVIIALTWVAAFALLQIANRGGSDCDSASTKESLYLWSALPFLLGFLAGIAGAVLCRIKRGLLVLAAVVSLGLACLSVVYSFVQSLACLS